MLRGIDCKSCTLFDTHRNAHVKKDYVKSRTLFGTHRKQSETSHVEWEWLIAPYSVRSENAHVNQGWLQVSFSIRHAQKTHLRLPQVSDSIRHAQEVHMLSKIDLKSRTLLGLYTEKRFVYLLSYFRTLSLGRMNCSLALDSTLWYSSFLSQSVTVVIPLLLFVSLLDSCE